MSNTPVKRTVNPQLGVMFAIIASLFIAMVTIALIGEQMAYAPLSLRWGMVVGPLAMAAAVGVMSATRNPIEFFAAGRRVPAVHGVADGTLDKDWIVAQTLGVHLAAHIEETHPSTCVNRDERSAPNGKII